MNATHGLPRRPGESPPNLPAAKRAAAYFGGRLSPEDLETLQDDLSHDPDLAETLLDWQCFAPPTAETLPTATLALWLAEDKTRLDVAIGFATAEDPRTDYLSGRMSSTEAERYQDHIAHDPELAESVLDWQAFASPAADVVSPEELASWQAADRVRLQAAIDAESAGAEVTPAPPVLQFPTPTTAPPPKRHAWKWLAASAALAAGLGGVMFTTAPVPETYIVPVSTLRGDDDVTTLELGRWPHKALFRIDARTLGEIAEPQAALLDSMTDAVVATTTAKPCGEALCAQFWGLAPGNYRLELNDLVTGQPRLVAYHPVELLATDRAP